jgi:hypothetical protein
MWWTTFPLPARLLAGLVKLLDNLRIKASRNRRLYLSKGPIRVRLVGLFTFQRHFHSINSPGIPPPAEDASQVVNVIFFQRSAADVCNCGQVRFMTFGRGTGYSGSVWVDTETAGALRVEGGAEEIESGFPITVVENAVEYDWVKINSQRYFLPVSAEMIIGSDVWRQDFRNVIELRNFRLFDSEMKVILDK